MATTLYDAFPHLGLRPNMDTFNTMKYVCCSHGDHVQGAECEALARKDDVGDVFSQYRGM